MEVAKTKERREIHQLLYERELYEKLRDLAVERGQTMTTAIERILKDYFDKLEDAEK